MSRKILIPLTAVFFILAGRTATLNAKTKIKVGSTSAEIKNISYQISDKIITITGTFKFAAKNSSDAHKFYVRACAYTIRNKIIYIKDHPLSGLEGKFTTTIEYDSSIARIVLSTGSYHRRLK